MLIILITNGDVIIIIICLYHNFFLSWSTTKLLFFGPYLNLYEENFRNSKIENYSQPLCAFIWYHKKKRNKNSTTRILLDLNTLFTNTFRKTETDLIFSLWKKNNFFRFNVNNNSFCLIIIKKIAINWVILLFE